jgi:hypothetical protein
MSMPNICNSSRLHVHVLHLIVFVPEADVPVAQLYEILNHTIQCSGCQHIQVRRYSCVAAIKAYIVGYHLQYCLSCTRVKMKSGYRKCLELPPL